MISYITDLGLLAKMQLVTAGTCRSDICYTDATVLSEFHLVTSLSACGDDDWSDVGEYADPSPDFRPETPK